MKSVDASPIKSPPSDSQLSYAFINFELAALLRTLGFATVVELRGEDPRISHGTFLKEIDPESFVSSSISPRNICGDLRFVTASVASVDSPIKSSSDLTDVVRTALRTTKNLALVLKDEEGLKASIDLPARYLATARSLVTLGISVRSAELPMVATITINSAAYNAGVRQGDMISDVSGQEVSNPYELVKTLSGFTGRTIEIGFVRSGSRMGKLLRIPS